MTNEPAGEIGPETAPPRTRDWVWGLVVVLGALLLITTALWWMLVGSSSCGTRPAAGYEDAGGAACRSVIESQRVAAAVPGPFEVPYGAAPAPARL